MDLKKIRLINYYTVICCILTIVIVIGAISFSLLYPEEDEKKIKIVRKKKITKKVENKKKKLEIPHFEIYPGDIDLSAPTGDKVHKNGLPKVAIIIDDIGFDKKIAVKLIELGVPVTLSVLPLSPFGDSIAFKAKEKDIELMLHLPMEPYEYPRVKPGPGALLSTMSDYEILNLLSSNIDEVPYIKGVNNHMGSKLTSDEKIMGLVMAFIKERGLFFIDSRTSKNTVCSKVAKKTGISFEERDIFLDHLHDEENIEKQLGKLVDVAEKKGWAIGIGHPHLSTVNVLYRRVNSLKERVLFVKASEIMKISDK